MRKTSIAENWSAVEELRMVISRVGEERRTLEAQLGKVNWKHFPIFGGTVNIMENSLIQKQSQLMEDRSAMARSVEEQGLRMVHLEKEGRQLEREV